MSTPQPSVPIALAPGGSFHDLAVLLRAAGPVARVILPGDVPAYAVTHREMVEQVAADDRFSADPGNWPDWRQGRLAHNPHLYQLTAGVFPFDGLAHRLHRALVGAALTIRRIHTLRPRINAHAAALARKVCDRLHGNPTAAVDLGHHYARPLVHAVLGELLGVDDELWKVWSAASPTAADAGHTPGHPQMPAVLEKLVAAKHASPADDLTTALIGTRHRQDRLDDAELIHTLAVFLQAGSGPAANLITSAVSALLERCGTLSRLIHGDYPWRLAVTETVRWAPSVPVGLRYTVCDLRLGDEMVLAGQPVVLCYAVPALGSDGAQEMPGQFIIDSRYRRHQEHLAFGVGPHQCLGEPLALLLAEIALEVLFLHIGDQAFLAHPAGHQPFTPSLLPHAPAVPVIGVSPAEAGHSGWEHA